MCHVNMWSSYYDRNNDTKSVLSQNIIIDGICDLCEKSGDDNVIDGSDCDIRFENAVYIELSRNHLATT